MNKVNIIIVDDHDLFRLGVRTAIENRHSDLSVVGEAKTGAELFRVLDNAANETAANDNAANDNAANDNAATDNAVVDNAVADIVLLDILLPDISGIEIARRLKAEHPKLKILAISAENTTATVQELLDIGIEGFISKLNSNADTLAEAIRSIMSGYEYFGSDIADIICRIYVAKKKKTEVTSEFTEQEKRIIELCHEGLPAKLIADRLGITSRTVDWHKSNIFSKLGINSTLEMVRYALRKGVFDN